VHELFGHLGYDTIFDAWEMIDGVDMLKALRLLKVVQQGHCDTCAINKTRIPPRPEGKTTRPTREARVQKLTIDVWGRVEEQSIFHHYHYLLMGGVHREKNWSGSWSRKIHDVESRAASQLLVFCCLTRDIDHESNAAR
jgi:hypothetical protein